MNSKAVAAKVVKNIDDALNHNPGNKVCIYVIVDNETVLALEQDWGIFPDYIIPEKEVKPYYLKGETA